MNRGTPFMSDRPGDDIFGSGLITVIVLKWKSFRKSFGEIQTSTAISTAYR